MKEFVVSDLEKFLEISDTIATPFKFLEVNENTDTPTEPLFELKATVWLRSALLTYESMYGKENYNETRHSLLNHGFVFATIREAPMILR